MLFSFSCATHKYFLQQAKTDKGLKEAFLTLARRILAKNPKAGGAGGDDQAAGVFGGGAAEP